MKFKVIFSPIAISNVEKAVEYYLENVSKTIASNFILELEETISILEINPYFKKFNKYYHIVPINKYPFLLFFLINESDKTVRVNAVFHTSQNPKKYPKH